MDYIEQVIADFMEIGYTEKENNCPCMRKIRGGNIMDYLSKLQSDYTFFTDMLKSLERRKSFQPICKNDVQGKDCRTRKRNL